MSKRYQEANSINPLLGNPISPIVTKAEGCYLYDIDNKRYFDASGGSGAVNLYHQHPNMVRAIKEQTDKLLHTGWNVQSEERLKLIQKLGDFSPFDECAVLFTLPGTEGIEAALKVARAYTGRKTVVSFERAFHGKSTGALALTWREKFKKYAVISEQSNVVVPYPIVHLNEEEYNVEYCLKVLEETVKDMCDNNNAPAAIILEPIQTSEGVLVPGNEFLDGATKIAKQADCLVIYDEIYTGFCRTGRKFCAGNDGMPDLLVLGKGLGNGIPISAVLGSEKIMNALPAGNHSCTFAANPLACAVGNAVIDTMNEYEVWNLAKQTGEEMKKFFNEMSEKYGRIANVRGKGLLLAFDCIPGNKEDSSVYTTKFVHKALDNGMILRYGGFNGATVKYTPPLIMNEEDVAFSKECIETTIKELM